MLTRINPVQFKQVIFTPMKYKDRDDEALNELADAPEDPQVIREILFKRQGILSNVDAIGALTNDYTDTATLSDDDALQIRIDARSTRSQIISDKISSYIIAGNDATFLQQLTTGHTGKSFTDLLKSNRGKLSNIKAPRIDQMIGADLNKIKLIATIVENVNKKTALDDHTLTSLAARHGNVQPSTGEMRARLKALQGKNDLALNFFKTSDALIDALSDDHLEMLHTHAVNQIGINTIRSAFDRMLDTGHPILTAIAVAPTGGAQQPAAVKQKLIEHANAGELGGIDPAIINRLSADQLNTLRDYAATQLVFNTAMDCISRINAYDSTALRDLFRPTTEQEFMNALSDHKADLGGFSPSMINRFTPTQLEQLYSHVTRKLINNNVFHHISEKREPDNATLIALTAPHSGGGDPNPDDIKERLITHKNDLGINDVKNDAIRKLPPEQVMPFLDQAIQQLARNQINNTVNHQLEHDNNLLTQFTAPAVGAGGGIPNADEIKQRIITHKDDLGIQFLSLTPGLVDHAIQNMSVDAANQLYVNALKQLIINKIEHSIEQKTEHDNATLTALKNKPSTTNKRQALYDNRAQLGINFIGIDQAVREAFNAMQPNEFDALYQQADTRLRKNKTIQQIGDGISDINDPAEHSNATLMALTAGPGVPSTATMKQRLHDKQRELGFAGATPPTHFTELPDPQTNQFYRQALKQLSTNKINYALQSTVIDSPPIVTLTAVGQASSVPTEAEIKHRLINNKNLFGLDFGGNDVNTNAAIDAAINSMSSQETRAFYIGGLKQLIVNKINQRIGQILAHDDNNALAKVTAPGTGANNKPTPVEIVTRLFENKTDLGLNFPNNPEMDTAIGDALGSMIDNELTSIYTQARKQLAINKVGHELSQKQAHDDPTLTNLTAPPIPVGGNISAVTKDRLIQEKNSLGIQDFDNTIIRAIPDNIVEAFHSQAVKQKAMNTIQHHIGQKTAQGNAILTALTASHTDDQIKANFKAKKDALGNIDDATIDSLSPAQRQTLYIAAMKQTAINAANYTITAIADANAPVLESMVGNPTTDVDERRRRILAYKTPLGMNTIPDHIIDHFSPDQINGIYQKILDKRTELQPYFKLLDEATGPLRTALAKPVIATTLKTHFAGLSLQDKQALLDALNDPNKKKDEIAALLTNDVHLAPPLTVDELAQCLFAENQYKRIFPTLDPALQTQFTSRRGTGQDGMLLHKLSQQNTPDEINALVNAVKDGNSKPSIRTAMQNLGLDPLQTNAYFAEREYTRLCKTWADDTFLTPLLQVNKDAIKGALASNPAITTSEQVDAKITQIKDADKNQLLGQLTAFGITQEPDPAGGAAIALTNDSAFASKAYHQLYSMVGDTARQLFDGGNASTIKNALKDISQASINTFINELYEDTERRGATTKINQFIQDIGLQNPNLPPDLNGQLFAEIQYDRLVAKTKAARPVLKKQIKDQKLQVIDALKKNKDLATPKQVQGLLNSLGNSVATKTDLQNAMGALGLATKPEELDAIFQENRKVREDHIQKTSSLTEYEYAKINTHSKTYFSRIDSFADIVDRATHSHADRNPKDIDNIDRVIFQLKEQLLLFKKSLEEIVSGKIQVDWMNPHERAKIDGMLKKLDSYLTKIATIETNLTTIHKQLETNTPPERLAYISDEQTVGAAVGTHSVVQQTVEDYLRGDEEDSDNEDIANITSRAGSGVRTTESFEGNTERYVKLKVMIKADDKAPAQVVRAALIQTHDPDTKISTTTLRVQKDDIDTLTKGEKTGYGFFSPKIPNDTAMRMAIEIIENHRITNRNSTDPIHINSKYPELVKAMVLYCKYMQKNTEVSGYDYIQPFGFTDKLTKGHEDTLHRRLHNDKNSGIYDLRHMAVGAKQAEEFREKTTLPPRLK